MLNRDDVIRREYGSDAQILFDVFNKKDVGIVVDSGVTAEMINNRAIVRAGTLLTGDMTNRITPFTEAAADGSDAKGVLLHDVDVTEGNTNGTLLEWGWVNLDRLTGDVRTATEAALDGLIANDDFRVNYRTDM